MRLAGKRLGFGDFAEETIVNFCRISAGAAVVAERTMSFCSRNACNQCNCLPAKHSRTDVADLVGCARKRPVGNIAEVAALQRPPARGLKDAHAHL